MAMRQSVEDSVRCYERATRGERRCAEVGMELAVVRSLVALELHEDGLTFREIAEQLHVNKARAQQLCARGREARSRNSDARAHAEALLHAICERWKPAERKAG